MSIVYDDIQAVTRLLQEKEKVICGSFYDFTIKTHDDVVLGLRANRSHW